MKVISIEELKEQYLLGQLKQGIYGSVNEDMEDVTVLIDRECGFDIYTNQSNGWVRLDCYDYDSIDKSWSYSEMYKGKWN